MATINTGNLFDDAISNIILILKDSEDTIGIHKFNKGDEEKNREDSWIDVKYFGHEEERVSLGSGNVKVIINLILRIEISIRRHDENAAENEVHRKVSIVSDILRARVDVNRYVTDVAKGGEGLSIIGSSRAERDLEDLTKSTAFIDININIIERTTIIDSVI